MKKVYYTMDDMVYCGWFEMTEPYCEFRNTWTDEAPPEFGHGQNARLVNGKWELIPDYRFVPLWAWDGSEVDLGSIKAGMTLDQLKCTDIEKPDDNHDWDMKTMSWKVNEAKKLAHDLHVWEERLQNAVRLVSAPIELHQDEQALSESLTITADLYKTYLQYRVTLRKLKPLEPIPPAPEGLIDG